ncbi:MAG TPA: hypothetical protein VF230_16960 [Acidimicrobiales bacterium]
MELAGRWRAAEADEARRRTFPDPDVADDGDEWSDVDVPGHWRTTEAFAASDGPLLLRKRFEQERPATGRRRWLELDGVFYQSDVWLDGSYVGDTEGYFVPHRFEITGATTDRTEHLLAVEVTCARHRDPRAKRNVTGAFQPTEGAGAGWNPGGIWRPVRVRETGPLAISSLRVLCLEATPERAVLAIRAVIDAPSTQEASLRTVVDGRVDHVEDQALAAGTNVVEWRVPVDQPRLWWPHALGEPALVDVRVSVETGGAEHDTRTVRTGLRQVRLKDWLLSVNGERLFLKGVAQGPSRFAIADATGGELADDVALAKEAGLDLLRLRAHVTRPEVYETADRLGMLLWQDLPLEGGYARGVRKQATRQATAAVDLLGHHPSIAFWCAHDEPVELRPHGEGQRAPAPAGLLRQAATFAVPTYTKAILDGSLHRALGKADRSRPVLAHSGVAGRSDAHLSFGWFDGEVDDLDAFAALWPRAVRFVGGFGTPAPGGSPIAGSDPAAFAAQGFDPQAYLSFEAWRDELQRHQAAVVKHHVETLRRLKYRPVGGFTYAALADAVPCVSAALVDHERVPKPSFEALVAACAPVVVVAERPAGAYRPGQPIALDVHVVNDTRDPIEGGVVTATLRWAGGSHEWRWTGNVAADAVVRVATIQAVAPATVGPLVLELDVDAPACGVKASNRYESTIVGSPGAA